MSRYTRDEIISQGLELSASPTVLQHDMPGGIVQQNAYSIKWLQNALDMFHRKYPFSSDVVSVAVTITANSEDITLTATPSLYLPTDFTLDVRNGIVYTQNTRQARLIRKSFQYFLAAKLTYQAQSAQAPVFYTVVQNRIKVAPVCTQSLSALLYYYKLPAILAANDSVPFPDEFVLIEFIRLKALEWTRALEPGTAQSYLTKQLAGLRSSGLLNESEYEDAVPIENNQILLNDGYYNPNAWMGGFPQT